VIATILLGLAIGSIYVFVAVGYNLTWLTSRAINFAQGALMVVGIFLTVELYHRHVPVILIFVILAVVGAILASVELVVAILPIISRGAHGELVTTVGAMTLIQGVIGVLVVASSESVPFFGPTRLVSISGSSLTPDELFLIPLAVVVGLGAHLWASRTKSGLAAVSLSEDRDAALVLGVNTRRFTFVAFMVSGALGLVVAPFVGPETTAVVSLATTFAVYGFVVLAIAGVGSQLGAVIGGLAIGVAQQLVARYVGPNWQNLAVFAVFLAFLMFRPTGLFGERRERVV
jgi:branched-chain amino acid transport system permease protein